MSVYDKPFPVRIIRDARDIEEKADGLGGICAGLYKYPDVNQKMPQDQAALSPLERLGYNPLIVLENGKHIWGMECWWTYASDTRSLEELQVSLNLQLALIIEALSGPEN